jgi:hypothetical protein
MTRHYHAALWIDHHAAHIVTFNRDAADHKTVQAKSRKEHLHHTAGSPAGGHLHGDPDYFGEVAAALDGAGELLVTGPSSAKAEFMTWLRQHHVALAGKVCAVETLDAVSEAELLAHARRYFEREDRMRPQLG